MDDTSIDDDGKETGGDGSRSEGQSDDGEKRRCWPQRPARCSSGGVRRRQHSRLACSGEDDWLYGREHTDGEG